MWRHEYALFRKLPKKVRLRYREEGIKEKSSLKNMIAGVEWRLKMFDECDENKDGKLDQKEFMAFYRKMEEFLAEKMGGSYHLSEEELIESH